MSGSGGEANKIKNIYSPPGWDDPDAQDVQPSNEITEQDVKEMQVLLSERPQVDCDKELFNKLIEDNEALIADLETHGYGHLLSVKNAKKLLAVVRERVIGVSSKATGMA